MPTSPTSNELLLRQASSGKAATLIALANEYCYKPFDVRPIRIAIRFIREAPPKDVPNPDDEISLQPVDLAYLCLRVLGKVGRAAGDNTAAYQRFFEAVGDDWASVFAWCRIIADYAVGLLSPELADGVVMGIGEVLCTFSCNQGYIYKLPDYSAPIALALRLWDRKFNSGRLADVSDGACFAGVTLFIISLIKHSDDTRQIVVDEMARRTPAFFQSVNSRLSALKDRLKRGLIGRQEAEGAFLLYTAILVGVTETHGGMDRYLMKHKSLVHFSESLAELSRHATNGEEMTTVLAHLLAMIEVVNESGCHFLKKLEHLVQGGLFLILRDALTLYTPASVQHDIAHSIILYIAPYMSYPPVLFAVSRTLGDLGGFDVLLSDDCRWKKFREALGRGTEVAGNIEDVFLHGCDNTGHPYLDGVGHAHRRKTCSGCKSVAYCSDTCQKQDWKRLHQFECAALSRNLRGLKSHGDWLPMGSGGFLARTLFQTYRERRQSHHEDTRAFADVKPQDLVTRFDFRLGLELVVTSMAKVEYFTDMRSCQAEPFFNRTQHMFMRPSHPAARLVEGAFLHNAKSIHVVAEIWGTPQTTFKFLRGVWLLRPDSEARV